jgi:hypothetical protein
MAIGFLVGNGFLLLLIVMVMWAERQRDVP